MLVYWMLFLVPALASLSPSRLDRRSQMIMLTLAGIALAILIGLRDDVGRDWNNYVKVANKVIYERFQDTLFQVEPAYGVVAWFSERLGGGIYGANFVCASILVLGLLAFCRTQPSPWLTLTLAIPVLAIGIGMSGVRQATAIGLLMFAMNAFVNNKLRSYIIWVLLAVTFHQTAAAMLPLAWFMRGRITVLPVVVAGGAFALLSIFVLSGSVSYYTESYLQESPEANGALPRVALNVAAALIFYYFRKEWALRYRDTTLYTVLALTAIPMAAAVFTAPVASDRMSMYLIPFQIGVFSRLPQLVHPGSTRQAATVATLILYALTLGIWLNFSGPARADWLPYKNILWQ